MSAAVTHPERYRRLPRRLRFADAEVEASFRDWRVFQAVPFVRAGAAGAFLGWLLIAIVSYVIGPELSRYLVPPAVVVFVLLGVLVWLTAAPRRWQRKLMIPWAAAANLTAGILLIVAEQRSPVDAVDLVSGVIVTLTFFAFIVLRLPPTVAAVTVAPYVLLQNVITTGAFTGEPLRVLGYTTLLWASFASGLLVCIVLERVARGRFRQECIIEDQHRDLRRERERSEALLRNILPDPIAEQLKSGVGVIADHHDEVTVLFADIVGFTPLAHDLPPHEIVTLLNSVFSRFDALAADLGVEKIKTVGDAYMAVAGLPLPRPDHVEACAELALGMREAIAELNRAGPSPIEFRIGFATGPVVAGVIGTSKFSYDLWGETVNTAARMESHGLPGSIQVTEAVAGRLAGRYRLRERGLVDLKGQGPTRTWILLDRADDAPPGADALSAPGEDVRARERLAGQ